MADGRHGASGGCSEGDKFAVDCFYLVAVAHPDDGFLGDASEKPVLFVDPATGAAEFPAGGRLDLAAQRLTGELHPVADAQNRNPKLEEGRITPGCAGLIDASRATGEDDAAWGQLRHAAGGEVMADNL